MNKLIYADELKLAIRDDMSINGANFAIMKQHINEARTIDAVEVVRCKDCKYFNQKTPVGGFCKCGEVCGGNGFMRVNDDFCSYGEIKEV